MLKHLMLKHLILKHLMLKHLMLKQPKKLKKRILNLLIYLACLSAGAFLTTCGLEEYYYLPQVPEGNIRTVFNTSATIELRSLTASYAQNYKIYYRIYISDFSTSSNETSLFNTISPSLYGDYTVIWPNTDPTSTTAGTPANTLFTNRNYFELELYQENINNILSKNGGNISISFPTAQGGYPVLSVINSSNNSTDYRLYRSNNLISPEPDKFFRNSSELSDPNKATSNINADVAGRTGLSQSYAYVSMYIVAAGTNQSTFAPIYSKPTFISVFRLPES